MQLTFSVIVKSVLLLLIDGHKRNTRVKGEKKYFVVLKARDQGQVLHESSR